MGQVGHPPGHPLLSNTRPAATQPRPALEQSGDAGPAWRPGSPLKRRMARVNQTSESPAGGSRGPRLRPHLPAGEGFLSFGH